MRRGITIGLLCAAIVACAPAPAPRPAPEASRAPTASPALAPALALDAAAPASAPAPRLDDPCRRDADCGYDSGSGRCGTDPRYNRQPPVVDQGIVCYCDDARSACARLRVDPVPCEGDGSCAVDPSPRPHPVRASEAHRHERGRRCKDFTLATTCERTNLCTLHRLECPR